MIVTEFFVIIYTETHQLHSIYVEDLGNTELSHYLQNLSYILSSRIARKLQVTKKLSSGIQDSNRYKVDFQLEMPFCYNLNEYYRSEYHETFLPYEQNTT